MKTNFLKFLFVLLVIYPLLNENSISQVNQVYKFNNLKNNKSPKLQGITDPYWITYFGGANSEIFSSITLDNNNDIIAVGSTYSRNLPVSPNAFQKNNNGDNDIYVAKFDFKGNLLWSTYIGGNSWEYAYGIKIDKYNRIWIVGETRSSNFPTKNSNFVYRGGFFDGIIICFDENGNLIYSTQIGGGNYDSFLDLAINDEYIYVVGRTGCYDYPITNDAFQKVIEGGYKGTLVRINLNTFNIFSSFVGTGPRSVFLESIAIDNNNDIILGGFTNDPDFKLINNKLNTSFHGAYDIWLMKLDSYFNIIWTNLYGGQGTDKVTIIKTDALNNIYCLGFTNSRDINLVSPIQNSLGGDFDALIFKLDKTGGMIWSTYLGGNSQESYKSNMQITDRSLGDLFLDEKNQRIAVNFRSASNNMFTTSDAFQSKYQGGSYDSYTCILDYNEQPYYATYFGGGGEEMSHSVYLQDSLLIISGQSSSSNLPVTENAYQKQLNGTADAFIAIFGIPLAPPPADTIPPAITGVVDSCGMWRVITVKDDQFVNSGLKDINIIKADNCNISFLNKTAHSVTINISLIDIDKNGYYTIELIDNAGNKTILQDSIISALAALSFTPQPYYDFGKLKFGEFKCENIKIHNNSPKDVELKDLSMAKNIDFSIPQSQFPILVPANDSVNLEVCFRAKFPLYGIYRDTITYFNNCIYAHIPLVAEIDTANYAAVSRCDIIINIISNYDSLSDPEPVLYPNPNRGIVWLNSNYKKGDISLEIYNILGEQIETMELDASSLPIDIDLSKITDGNYIFIIRQKNIVSINKILLIK